MLMCDTPQLRAAFTLVRRLHHPFLLGEPLLRHTRCGSLLLAWLYDSPAAANTPSPQVCVLLGEMSNLYRCWIVQ